MEPHHSIELRATPMGPLRILHLEDDKADRALVRQALAPEKIDFDFVYASSRDEFAAALEREKFDLILADIAIPGCDGTAALALAQQKHPDVPYLFVAESIGEERAIDCLKNGATDFVLKHKLERLPPAIRRAMDEAGGRARRRAADAALRRSEERFRAMAESIDDVFWIGAADGHRLLYVSPAYERIWGRPLAELYAQPAQWLDAIVPEDRPAAIEARERCALGQEYRIAYRILRPDGTQRWIEDRSYPSRNTADEANCVVGVAMDITSRKQLESQLLQAQKMEAVGQLAGGVAHDFNNVLTVVSGYARLLLDSGSLPLETVEPLTQIYTAGARAANLIRQLLVFSRKQAVNRRIIDLNEVVSEMATMLGRLIGEHIHLRLELAPAPATIDADAVMMEQVLMNLAINARDAMPNGGTLTLGTAAMRIDDASARAHPEVRCGDFVCLSVRDTGCGIPEENRSRIFEPFFSTKEMGHGTGLGLATAFGIVQQHQGWIDLESTVGAGTCFRVMLPAVLNAVAMPARRAANAATPSGGSETMLLVEDEPSVREFAVAVLRSHGYRVLQASSGQEALEVWKWHGSRVSLLFSDLVLPEGSGGVELAATLRKEKPTLRVLLTSGHANEMTGGEFRPPPGMHFIHKPYKPQMLAQMVREALDSTFNR